MLRFSDNTKIGLILVGLGLLFLFLGVVLFFDSSLMAIGNILFLAGIPFCIGVQATLRFFNPLGPRRAKWRGMLAFFAGILLVLLRWAVVGIIVEVVGMLDIFAGVLPLVVETLRRLPYVGQVFSLPGVGRAVDWLAGAQRRTKGSVV